MKVRQGIWVSGIGLAAVLGCGGSGTVNSTGGGGYGAVMDGGTGGVPPGGSGGLPPGGGGFPTGGSGGLGAGGSGGVGAGGSGGVGAGGSGGVGAGGTGGAACVIPSGASAEHLLTFSAIVDPARPILFRAGLAVTGGPGAPALELTVVPLDAKDRTTPVGSPATLGPAPIDSMGNFVVGPNALSVPGAANPISGSDLEVTVTLHGELCGTGFYCGTATGDVTSPIPIDIDGSTFTLQKYPSPGVPPDPPLIDCNQTPAGPPPP